MSKRVILATVLVMLLALPVAVYAQATDPQLKAEEFIDAANNGDVAGASAVVAEDAVVTVPKAMSETGGEEGEDPAEEQQAVGKAEIEAWIEGLTAANAETTLGECVVEGEMVTCDASFTSDALAAMGVGAVEGELKVKVNAEGMIESYDFVASADSVAKLQAAGAAAAAPAAMPVTGGGSLPPNALAVVLGGLMVAGGLGVQALKRRGR